jgi:hypothetical protein
MSTKNFVREIRADDVKDINPKDIVYLAMKDGSILLITDNDENIIDFGDIDSLIKRKYNRNYIYEKYNNNKFQIKASSSHSRDNNKTPSTYSNYSKDKTKTSSYYSREKEQNKSKAIIPNRKPNERNNNYKGNDISNKYSKIAKTNYTSEVVKISPNLTNKIKNERLEPASNNTNISHKRTHVINGNNNNNYQSNSTTSKVMQKNKSTRNYLTSNAQTNDKSDKNDEKFKKKFHSNYDSPVQNKYNNNFFYENKRKNNLNNDKNNNISEKDNNNKNIPIRKFDNNYSKESSTYKYTHNYNKDIQIRNDNISDKTTSISNFLSPQKNYDNRKGMEISGKFVICDDMNKLAEHGHNCNLFKQDFSFCDNFVKNNKLSLTDIKEDELGSHGFIAIFGRYKGKKGNN